MGAIKSMAGPRPRSRVSASYPAALKDQGIRGYVIAQFVVDTNGRPAPASLLIRRASNEAFIPPVIEAVRKQIFSPATTGTIKCPSVAKEPFVFEFGDVLERRAVTGAYAETATVRPNEILPRPVPTSPARLHDGWDIDNVALNQRGRDLDATARRTP
jgi:TonB family protein